MLELLRKHQHGIMIVVAFIVIIAFAWLFNPYDASRGRSLTGTNALTVAGKTISLDEVERQRRILQAANQMGFSFTMQLLQPTFDVMDFTQNRLLLRQEARKLGIEPTEEDVLKAIGNHTGFQTSGKFDQSRYDDAIANTLQPSGLQPGDLRELVADKIIIEKLDGLLGSNSDAPKSRIDMEYQSRHETVSASVVDFKLADAETKVEVNDDDLKTYYADLEAVLPGEEARANPRDLTPEETEAMENLLSKEQRQVSFVFFEQPANPAGAAPTPGAGSLPGLGLPGTNQTININPDGGVTPPTININPDGGATPPTININPDAGSAAPTIEIPQIEIPGAATPDPEAQPPGQAPDPLNPPKLETEPLPTPPAESLEDLGNLTPPDQLGGDFSAGGLTDAPAPGEGTSLLQDATPGAPPEPMLTDPTAPTVSIPMTPNANEEHEQKMREYEKRVDDFYTKLFEAPDSFADLATAEGIDLQESELFDQDNPPAAPRMPTELVTAIFKAQADNDDGVMVPVEGSNPAGFYVVRIVKAEEPKTMSFDEAKETLTEAYKKREAAKALRETAEAAREKISKALANGTSFADAAKASDLEVRVIDDFSTRKRPTGAHAQQLLEAAAKTITGSVSEPVEAGDDLMLLAVTKRVGAPTVKTEDEMPAAPGVPPTPGVDPEQEKSNIADQLNRQARNSLFGLWLANRRDAVGVKRNPAIAPMIYFPYGNRNFGF